MALHRDLTGEDNLICFARNGDWAACFKSTDTSGNPKVYVYDFGNRANRYERANFDAWLSEEIRDCTDGECDWPQGSA
ncbi:hypothetical protein NBRC116584_35360 [Hydrogenophaga sp. 5NK40-0174]